jgi:pre-rRNA-processing protein TSR4
MDDEPDTAPVKEKTAEEMMEDYQKLKVAKDVKQKIVAEEDEQTLAPGFRQSDEAFLCFQERTSREPTQVLRYDKGGAPLWIGPSTPKAADVPHCERCGGARVFEFQIMPQLTAVLDDCAAESSFIGTLDWGVLAVYSCANSCSIGNTYAQEFIWANVVALNKEDMPEVRPL